MSDSNNGVAGFVAAIVIGLMILIGISAWISATPGALVTRTEIHDDRIKALGRREAERPRLPH